MKINWLRKWVILLTQTINVGEDVEKKESSYTAGNNKGTCTPMLTAALFTIAKLWKQSRCHITDE
jgi:hypothetical protein